MARSHDATSSESLNKANPGSTLNSANGPFTVAFWFKANATTQTNRYLFAQVNASNNQWGCIYEYVADGIEFWASGYSGGNPRTNSSLTISDTNWHHVAYRKDASGASSWNKFLDGTKTEISASIDFTLPASMNQTALFNATSTASNAVNGQMQDMVWWDSDAISDEGIAALAKGVSFKLLGVKALVAWELFGNQDPEPDFYGVDDLTVDGPTKSAHNPLIYPAPPFISYPTAAAPGNAMPMAMDHYRRRRIAA